MDLRTRISDGLKEAMRAKDTRVLSTLRLVNAAIKDREIAMRVGGGSVGDDEIMAILSKMVKQRQESARAYEEGGRLELAEQEHTEIGVIETYLPKQLSEVELSAALEAAMAEVGAESLRDMGKVMGVLKAKYTGRMDFGTAGAQVKARLS